MFLCEREVPATASVYNTAGRQLSLAVEGTSDGRSSLSFSVIYLDARIFVTVRPDFVPLAVLRSSRKTAHTGVGFMCV